MSAVAQNQGEVCREQGWTCDDAVQHNVRSTQEEASRLPRSQNWAVYGKGLGVQSMETEFQIQVKSRYLYMGIKPNWKCLVKDGRSDEGRMVVTEVMTHGESGFRSFPPSGKAVEYVNRSKM
jgi:hypothetical protein